MTQPVILSGNPIVSGSSPVGDNTIVVPSGSTPMGGASPEWELARQQYLDLVNAKIAANQTLYSSIASIRTFATAANPVDLSGQLDSSAAVQTAVTALAGLGIALFIDPGTLLVNNRIILPNNAPLLIFGVKGRSIIKGGLIPNADPTNAIFFGQNTTAGATTLAANAVTGTNQLSVTSLLAGAIAIGSTIAVSSVSLRTQFFIVKNIAGVGPFTVTVDRIVQDAYTAAGSSVTAVPSQPTEIVFRDLTFTGTATRYIEVVAGYRCEGQGLTLQAPATLAGDILASFDIGGRECFWRDSDADCNGAPLTSGGFALESNENSHMVNCNVVNCTQAGTSAFAFYDCFDCTGIGCEANNSYLAYNITADGNALGSDGTRLVYCRSLTAAFAHYYQANGSKNTNLVACKGKTSIHYGTTTDGNTSNLTVLGGEMTNCDDNVLVAAGTANTKLEGVDLSTATTAGVYVAGAGGVQIGNCTMSGNVVTALTVAANAEVDISGFRCTATLTGGLIASNGNIRARGIAYNGNAAVNMVQANAGRIDISESKIVVAGAANIFVTAAASAQINIDRTVASGGSVAFVAEPGTITATKTVDVTGVPTLAFVTAGGVVRAAQSYSGAVAAAGTLTHDLAVPTDSLISVHAFVRMVGRTAGHVTDGAAFYADAGFINNNGVMATPAVIAGSANPANSANLLTATAAYSTAGFNNGGVSSSAAWSVSALNARLTVSNAGLAVAATAYVDIEYEIAA